MALYVSVPSDVAEDACKRINTIIESAVSTREKEIAEEVTKELVKITNDNCVRDFHPTYSDGVVNGKKEALFKVLKILNYNQ